jgi:hypothetical protein
MLRITYISYRLLSQVGAMAESERRQDGGIHIREIHHRSGFQRAQEMKDQGKKRPDGKKSHDEHLEVAEVK